MLKKLRITFLAYVLVVVAVTTWSNRARNAEWEESLWVTVYPINGDGSVASAEYIEALTAETFESIEAFILEQSAQFKLAPNLPVDVKLASEIAELPPPPPRASSGLGVAFWSLKMRWWAWSKDNYEGPKDIQMFVIYFDPEDNPRLRHSLGLQKGFLGVVNAFADREYNGRNNVVIAHELLHTLGATDKYDPRTNQPVHPEGFADPFRQPLFPQNKAELMAGRIPRTVDTSEMPNGLSQSVIGPLTAREIGWAK